MKYIEILLICYYLNTIILSLLHSHSIHDDVTVCEILFFCPRCCYTNSKRGQVLLFGYTPLGFKLQQWLFNSPTKRADEIPAPLGTKSHFALENRPFRQKETSFSTHWFSGVNSLLLSGRVSRVSCSLVLRDTAAPLEFGRCLHHHLPIPSFKKKWNSHILSFDPLGRFFPSMFCIKFHFIVCSSPSCCFGWGIQHVFFLTPGF